MLKRKSRKGFREPTRYEWRLVRGAEKLEHIFDEDSLAELLTSARRRVTSIIHHSTEWRRGKFRRTDNYVLGVGGHQKDLARHICSRLNKDFVYLDHLPDGVEDLSQRYLDDIIDNLQYRLILADINQMVRDADLWYDEATGIWQTTQRCHDLMKEESSRVKRAYKFDRRNWHGRPREQARRRGTPPGESIGRSKPTVIR